MTVIRIEPQITQHHKKYTHVQHRNCEWGLAKACCTQAGPAHAADRIQMAWTDGSYPFWHAQPVAPITVARRDLSPVTGTVSQATKTNGIDRLPCGYLYRSIHWIGNSTSSLCPCCCNRGGRLLMVHVFDCYAISGSFLNLRMTQNTQQTNKHTHAQAQWIHASVGLAQAHPNNHICIAVQQYIVNILHAIHNMPICIQLISPSPGLRD